MKKNISKRNRILRNLILIVLVFAAADFFSGVPFPVTELQFRVEERGKLVGPSEILGMEKINFSWCDKMIVAETEEGAILWISGRDYDRSDFAYRKKGPGSLLMAPPGSLGYVTNADELRMPLVLFDDQPRAARAEIRFTLSETVNGEQFEETYVLSSRREARGYFLFTLSAGAGDPLWMGPEGVTLQIFCNIASNQEQNPGYSVPVQVRYYDSRDFLIAEEIIAVTGAPGD